MIPSTENIAWIDLEMTGLDAEDDIHPQGKGDVILEAAIIITDKDLNILEELGPIYIHQPEDVLLNMNEWCVRTHTASGLLDHVRVSHTDVTQAEDQILALVSKYCLKVDPVSQRAVCYIAGNSIEQDRRFIRKYMKRVDTYFNYRHFNVSTFEIVRRLWYPNVPEFTKKENHRALDDIRESIAQMKYFKDNLLK